MTTLKFPPLKSVQPKKFPQNFIYAPKANCVKKSVDSFITVPKEVTSSKMGEAKFESLKNFVKGLFCKK
ncbi:hypothetical protein J6A31_04255 [bacterium]|nr:hypothetical protein [bacterium]